MSTELGKKCFMLWGSLFLYALEKAFPKLVLCVKFSIRVWKAAIKDMVPHPWFLVTFLDGYISSAYDYIK